MPTVPHIRDTGLWPAALGLWLLIACLLVAHSTIATADEFDIDQYRGQVVVVDFWASWCVPCRRSFPWLNAMQDKYGEEGLVVIGINVDKDPGEAQAFLKEFPARFRIVSDPNGDLARKFDVIAMPSSYVIARNGEIAETHLGFKVRKQDEYEGILVRTLNSN